MNQTDRNAKHRQSKGLVLFSALVRPASKKLFSEIRQCNNITTAVLFEQMIAVYQKQSVIPLQSVITLHEPENVITLQTDNPEQETVIKLKPEHAAINLDMPVEERKQFALELLKSHGGNKVLAMAELKAMLQKRCPGFSADRNKNRTGIFAEPMKLYSGVSNYLGRYLKSQQS